MNFEIISKSDLIPSVWDGGETFQYYIYPAESLYAERNFWFRISSASIKKVPSHFTRFADFHRYLVMLDNSLEIERNGASEKYTTEEVFEFQSNDAIVSFSLGHDFNLMVSEKLKFSAVQIVDGWNKFSNEFIFVFAKENMGIQLNGNVINLNANDLLHISNLNKNSQKIKSDKKMIVASIDLK